MKKIAAVCATLVLLTPQAAFASAAGVTDAPVVTADAQPLGNCPTWLWWFCGTPKRS
ncbi:hypothetical protein [Bifidobacterium pseudolongum]|uniref:hypothetical protein n=1 Tax=Bifidobacterium pseudolongum TaxID=1694 RepID=UPI0010DEC879|nr:hypothetical protein [Bifidobacterium pseudolongum]RYQ02257.1 hypothetical protein PG2115B_0231 [Bifidobacterium pseudolongum subsp. globosum]RYQ06444.1 hypothetical protein PG2114B_0217 [Bifidobacterium pseudolongum subsp. globosum]RYQ13239.1 hypothetical protein PG2089B_0212 [Bifidobacterium pseudolongum subsp. globosum]